MYQLTIFNASQQLEIYEPCHEKTCLGDFLTRPDTNQLAQPQKLAGVLKFRL